jgi:hypothetical protein
MTGWVYDGVEFNSGDRVMVAGFTDSFDPNGMGEGVKWFNVWEDEMNDAIFHEFEINHISEEGVCFVDIEGYTSSMYMFPLSVLKKIN